MKLHCVVFVSLCDVAFCATRDLARQNAVDNGVKSIKQMDKMIQDGTAPLSVVPNGGDSSEDKRSWFRSPVRGMPQNDDRRSSPWKYGSASPEHLMSSAGYWDQSLQYKSCKKGGEGLNCLEGFLLAQGGKKCNIRALAWPDQPIHYPAPKSPRYNSPQLDPGDGPASGFAPDVKNKRYSFAASKGFCMPNARFTRCADGATANKWRVEGFGGKYVCISSNVGLYLEARPNGKVDLRGNYKCTPAARYKVEGKVGDLRFKSKFGTYLGLANNENLVHGKWGYWKKRENFWIIGKAGWKKKDYWPKKENGNVIRPLTPAQLKRPWKNTKFTSTQARFELFCQGVLDGCLDESMSGPLNYFHRTFTAKELLERKAEKVWCPPVMRCRQKNKGTYKEKFCKGRKEGECMDTMVGYEGCSAFHVENHGMINQPTHPGHRLMMDMSIGSVSHQRVLNFWGHGSYVCITGKRVASDVWKLKALKTGELVWTRDKSKNARSNTDCTGAFRFKLEGAIRKEGLNAGYHVVKTRRGTGGVPPRQRGQSAYYTRGNWYTWRHVGTNVPVVGIKTKYGKYIVPYRHCDLLDTKQFPESDDGLRKWKSCMSLGRRLTAKELKLVKPKTNQPGYMKSYGMNKVCDSGIGPHCMAAQLNEIKFMWPGWNKGKPKMPTCTAAQLKCSKGLRSGMVSNNGREFAYNPAVKKWAWASTGSVASGSVFTTQSKFDKNAHFRIQCAEPCLGPSHTYSRPTPPPPSGSETPGSETPPAPKPAPKKISAQKKKELVKVVTQVITKTVGQKPSRQVVSKIVNKIARRKPTTGVIKRIITRVVGQKPSRRVIRRVVRHVKVRRPSRPGKNGKWLWIPHKGRGPQGPLSNEGPWSWPLVNGPGLRWPKQSPRNQRDVYNQIFRDVLYKQQLRKLLYRNRFHRLRNRRDVRNVIFTKRLRDLFHNPPRAQCNRR